MDESQLRTIEQIEQFLTASARSRVYGPTVAAVSARYAHISRVLRRFD